MAAIMRSLLGFRYAPMAISALAVVLCGLYADHQNRQLFQERSRAAVLSQLSLIQARLEGDIKPFMTHLQYFKDLLALPRRARGEA